MKIFAIFFLALFCSSNFAQNETSEQYNRWNLLVGIGAGTKSHFGNIGITGNLFFSRFFSIKFSAGTGAINNNGGIVSGGLEFDLPFGQRNYLIFGSCYTYAGEYYQVYNDESIDKKSSRTLKSYYSRSYAGFGRQIAEGKAIIKLEVGYSYSLSTPLYILNGPGVWTGTEILKFQNKLSSGLLVSFTFQAQLFNRNKE